MSTDVRGRIAIDVQFWDRTSAEGVQSLKTIALQDSTEYTTGKVAILTGTCGTAAVTVFQAQIATPYKDASGSAVTFASSEVKRLAASSPQEIEVKASGPDFIFGSSQSRLAISDMPGAVDFITVAAKPSGTASYTLVIYGT